MPCRIYYDIIRVEINWKAKSKDMLIRLEGN